MTVIVSDGRIIKLLLLLRSAYARSAALARLLLDGVLGILS
jgi:hypothetical protein